VERARPGALDVDVHVGKEMPDRLEAPDRVPELAPLRRVRARELEDRSRGADGIRRRQHGGDRGELLDVDVEHVDDLGSVETHEGGYETRVERPLPLERNALCDEGDRGSGNWDGEHLCRLGERNAGVLAGDPS